MPQQSDPIEVAPNTVISLQRDGRFTSQTPATPTPPGKNLSTDPQSVTLLLTATPADAKTQYFALVVSLPVFTDGDLLWRQGRWEHKLKRRKSARGADLGFTPIAIQTTRSVSLQNTPFSPCVSADSRVRRACSQRNGSALSGWRWSKNQDSAPRAEFSPLQLVLPSPCLHRRVPIRWEKKTGTKQRERNTAFCVSGSRGEQKCFTDCRIGA